MNQLVSRIVHTTTPVTVEYRITAHGETFVPCRTNNDLMERSTPQAHP